MSNTAYVAERSEIGCSVRHGMSSGMDWEISLVKNQLGRLEFFKLQLEIIIFLIAN